jgi:hypothetical protein
MGKTIEHPLILALVAQVPYQLPHLTHRDMGNADNRMERLQPPSLAVVPKGEGTNRLT